MVSLLKGLKFNINGLRPLKEAIVTSGGISTREIDPSTMKSRVINNLSFAGEIIDVDGDCGGYNLEWAWISGMIAGRSV